jgi:hypothetical protein
MKKLPWELKKPESLAQDLVAMFRKWPWSQYDGVRDPNPQQVTILDAVVSVVLESNFVYGSEENHWRSLGASRVASDAFLQEFGLDLALWELVPEVARAVDQLSNLILGLEQSHEWGASKFTKVLHRKRPRLVPILDSVLVGAFDDSRPSEEGKREGLVRSCIVLVMFRQEIISHRALLEDAIGIAVDSLPAIRAITLVRAAEALIYWNTSKRMPGGWDGTGWG